MDRLISEKSVMEVIYGCDWIVDEEHAEVIKERIKSIPSAEQKTGHWIEYRCDMYICSECDNVYTDLSGERYGMNYCPNCGLALIWESEEA